MALRYGLLTDWGFATRCFFGFWADLGPPAELGPEASHQEQRPSYHREIEIDNTIATPAVAMISGAS